MKRLRSLFGGTEPAGARRLTVATAASVVVGVLVIVVGNLAGWGWTRIIGATMISIGGLGFGIVIGLVEPRRERLHTVIARQRTTIAIAIAVILVLPVVAVLVAAVIGLFSGDSRSTGAASGAGLRIGGTLVGLFLLVASVASTGIAVRATQRADRNAAKHLPHNEATTTPTGEGA